MSEAIINGTKCLVTLNGNQLVMEPVARAERAFETST